MPFSSRFSQSWLPAAMGLLVLSTKTALILVDPNSIPSTAFPLSIKSFVVLIAKPSLILFLICTVQIVLFVLSTLNLVKDCSKVNGFFQVCRAAQREWLLIVIGAQDKFVFYSTTNC